MDPATLAAAAGAALIGAMTTSAWQQVSSAIARLWRRASPKRAQTIAAELEKTHTEAVAAQRGGDAGAVGALAEGWDQRLRKLMEADPDVTAELQAVLEDVLMPVLGPADRQQVASIIMTASASGEGRVYQAGRDQWISGQ